MAGNDQSEVGGQAPRVPLGGDYWQADPGAPLWGLADTHAHLMAHLAFGGRALWGLPYDPEHPDAAGLGTALGSCAPVHGGFFNINPEFGHQPGGGYPDFHIWPRFTTIIHQQGYLDWLYRAYQGGLRLVTCLAVNNELLASKTNPQAPHDDHTAIKTQIDAMKDLVIWLDAHNGGPGCGWLQIAYTPDDARRIVGDNKLAVVLGVEVDSLGNWRRVADLEQKAGGDANAARRLIEQELDWLYEMGVRQITPIHLTNNAFGGSAIYIRFLEISNVYITGQPWEIEDAFASGVRYRLDQDGADLLTEIERRIASLGPGAQPIAMNRHTLIDGLAGLDIFADHAVAPNVKGGHANARGLNNFGVMLLEAMMQRGMIIDIDHMSQKATDAALDVAEHHGYPVISSHGSFRELAYTAKVEFTPDHAKDFRTGDVHKVAHEAMKRPDQVARIAALGGLIAPILNQGDLPGTRPEPCAGSASTWAQAYLHAVEKMGGRGVALGSDLNGAAGLPGPRFGTSAAYGARTDALGIAQRRGQIDRQTNGVRYDRPLRDYRWFRFEDSGPGGYAQAEREIWQGVAEYKAGFNPWIQKHPVDDEPDANILDRLTKLGHEFNQTAVDNVAKGLWAADRHVTAQELSKWPPEQQAAYIARSGKDDLGLTNDPLTKALVLAVQEIWAKWEAMNGDNPPLTRCLAGPRRDFDINIDGFAHYGLLPDFLQDLRNLGLTPQELAPLFRSAYDYVELWQKCVDKRPAPAQEAAEAVASARAPRKRAPRKRQAR